MPLGQITKAKAGYGIITGPGYVKEFDTRTCFHCNSVYVTRASDPKVKTDLGGFCRVCMRDICSCCCSRSETGEGCIPFEKKLLEFEQRRQLDIALQG